MASAADVANGAAADVDATASSHERLARAASSRASSASLAAFRASCYRRTIVFLLNFLFFLLEADLRRMAAMSLCGIVEI